MSELEPDSDKPLPQTLNPWQGKHVEIWNDNTPALLVEGSRMCAKTTLLLDKEIHKLRTQPGIHTFICRYTDISTKTKLRPRFEAICKIRGFLQWEWNSDEMCYEFPNGSKCYAFGLKAANQNERYDKIRGLDVSRVYNDQSETVPDDIGAELMGASCRQKGFKHQVTFSPNPVNTDHWLTDKRHAGFPEDNSVAGRRHYRLEIYDNAYNLDPSDIARMESIYPKDHARHGAMILGKRGFNVVGNPVFEETFNRRLHKRRLDPDTSLPILEAFDVGKFNVVWVVAQRFHAGGLAFLAGIIGENMFLEDFLPVVREHREEWFGLLPNVHFKTTCPPPGQVANNGTRFTNLTLLHRAGFKPAYRDNANAADVRLALIEQLAGYMRRRNAGGHEAFGINDDESRWLKVSHVGLEPWPFMAQAFEAGIVWDEHLRSVSNNPVRQIKDDDWFANVARAASNIELNFCANRPTEAEREERAVKARATGYRPALPGSTSPDSWMA